MSSLIAVVNVQKLIDSNQVMYFVARFNEKGVLSDMNAMFGAQGKCARLKNYYWEIIGFINLNSAEKFDNDLNWKTLLWKIKIFKQQKVILWSPFQHWPVIHIQTTTSCPSVEDWKQVEGLCAGGRTYPHRASYFSFESGTAWIIEGSPKQWKERLPLIWYSTVLYQMSVWSSWHEDLEK